jgi:N-methylhydantoinase A/oxoprolinase/acetone carboxylase beta subunit
VEPGEVKMSEEQTDKTVANYVIGIDTGGTYTDCALLNYDTREVIDCAKTLTTRRNLSLGVVEVLDSLPLEDPSKVKMVGISSTLATNSIAEGSSRKVGLLLIGYDPQLVEQYSLDEKFRTEVFEYFTGGHDSQGREQAELDLDSILHWVDQVGDQVEAFAISSYFSPLNPDHEERAFRAIKEVCDLPIVLGHQLSTKLDSIKRAATACINASLTPLMKEFIESVRLALREKKILAPLMIVKGDGSLMQYEEAIAKPVETVLSGPAASSIGGRFLSGKNNALMIDVGGTTTDMALIKDSQVEVSEEGARVGEVETAIKAARIRTVCVGCDSAISIDDDGLTLIGPRRVIPLSRLASTYPKVERRLIDLKRKKPLLQSESDIQFWVLNRRLDDEELAVLDDQSRKILDLLSDGPKNLAFLLKKLKMHHPVQLNAACLFEKGYLELAALTPTDLLHANGEMDNWSIPAAVQAVKCLCLLYNKDRAKFIKNALEQIVHTIVAECLIFLADHEQEKDLPNKIDDDWGRWFLNEALSRENSFFSINISSSYPIIGIGAPAEIFVKRVAKILNAPFILPDNYHVANAVGAVAGSIMVDREAIVYVKEEESKLSYHVRIENDSFNFKDAEQAADYARKQVKIKAREGAVRAGAFEPEIAVKMLQEGSIQRFIARAVGNPILCSEEIAGNNDFSNGASLV